MPRVRSITTIFDLKINAKLVVKFIKSDIFLFFLSLNNIVSDNLSFFPFLLC